MDEAEAAMRGVAGQQRVPSEFLENYQISLPNPTTQQKIANFLDRKTREIGRLMEKKRKLLRVLQERKISLITSGVTRGINNNVKLHKLDNAWFDKLPDHWQPIRIKHVIRNIEQGWSPKCHEVPSAPEEWGVLKAGCVNDMEFKPAENKQLPDDLEPKPDLAVQKGDVLMSRANTRGLVGSCAKVENTVSNLLLCDKLYRFDFDESMCKPSFFVYAMNAAPSREQIELDASGASQSMVNISQQFVREMWIPLPPVNEQEEIVDSLDGRIERLSDLRIAIKHAIDKMEEKRQVLITKAVTGQIDLSDWQSPEEHEATL